MRLTAALTAALMLASSTALAERDMRFEDGLVTVGGPREPLPAATPVRAQLIHHDRTSGRVVGAVSTGLGVVALTVGWVLYVARQNYRLTPRASVTPEVVGGWERRGMWSLTLTGFGAANLVAGEYLLLPESRAVPVLAWVGGVGGLAMAAVGVGFWAGGTSCAPVPVGPGSEIPLACLAGTADATFGPLLLMSSAPLLNLPLAYLLRNALGSDVVAFTGSGFEVRGRF